MLLTALCDNRLASLLVQLWILQICCIHGATYGAILSTTRLYEIHSSYVTEVNATKLSSESMNLNVATEINTTNNNATDGEALISVVTVNVRSLFKRKEFRKEKVNLILLPGLALVCFVTMVCFRICKWKRDDMKFKTRGCSYDVANYVILTEGDSGFHDVEIGSNYDTVNSYASMFQKHSYKPYVYDTITSYKSLQYRIDAKMYSNVSTYNSYLRSPIKRKGMIDYEIKVTSPKHKRAGKDKRSSNENVKKEPVARKIPGTRFSVAPALENYVRLKRENLRSMTSSPNTLSDATETSAPGTPTSPRRNGRHKVSFTERSRMRETGHPSKPILLSNKCDKEVQVTIPRTKRKRTISASSASCSVGSDTGWIDRNSIEMRDLSAKQRNTTIGSGSHVINKSALPKHSSNGNCKIVIEADVHDKSVLLNDFVQVHLNHVNGESVIGQDKNSQKVHQSDKFASPCKVTSAEKDLISNKSEGQYDEGMEIINSDGFKRVRLSAPKVNGLVGYHTDNGVDSADVSNRKGKESSKTSQRVKRPRSLSPLHHVRISPKDVQNGEYCNDEKCRRKFSLGALHEKYKNGSDSCLSGRKSFSSIRDLIRLPMRSESTRVASNCGSSDSVSLLSYEENNNISCDNSTESLSLSAEV